MPAEHSGEECVAEREDEQGRLDTQSASDALVRLLEISWQVFAVEPFLLSLPAPPSSSSEVRDLHEPVLRRLEQLVERGQREADFDPHLPVTWILTASVALGHAAGEEAAAAG